MSALRELRREDLDVLKALQQQHPLPFHVKVFRQLPNGREVIVPHSDGTRSIEHHPIDRDNLLRLNEWLANNPEIGPGYAYRVAVYQEDIDGKIQKMPKRSVRLEQMLSPTEAASVAAASMGAQAEAREQTARMQVGAALTDTVAKTEASLPKIEEAAQMATSPDPTAQAAGVQLLAQTLQGLSETMRGFRESATGLQAALAAPRPSMPAFAPLPSSVPAPSALTPAPAAAGMPQIVNLLGYGPMALIGGQLVPINAPAARTEPDANALLRELLQRQAAPATDPRVLEELRQAREASLQAQRDAQQIRYDAEKRAAEAERAAERARHEAELHRVAAESEARLQQLRLEFQRTNPATDSSMQFLQLLQEQQRSSQALQAQMQKDAAEREDRWRRDQADRDQRYQSELRALQESRIAMLQEQAAASPSDQFSAITKQMADVMGTSMNMMSQAARLAAMGGGGQKKEENPLVKGFGKLIDQLGEFGTAIVAASAGGQASPQTQVQEQPQLPPAPQQVAASAPPAPAQRPSAPAPAAAPQQPPAEPAQPAVLDAHRMLNEARTAAGQRRLEDAFRLLIRAMEIDPRLGMHGGTDDLRDLRAMNFLLTGYVPQDLSAQEVGQAAAAVMGPAVIPRLIRLFQENQPKQEPAPPAAESAAPAPAPAAEAKPAPEAAGPEES